LNSKRDQLGQVTPLTGDNALQIVPGVLSGDHMRYVLRVNPDGQGGVEGLGAKPGLLSGEIILDIPSKTEHMGEITGKNPGEKPWNAPFASSNLTQCPRA
jgi:hypothetical protein